MVPLDGPILTAFCARPSIRDTVIRSAEDTDANSAQMPVPALPLTQDPLPEGEQERPLWCTHHSHVSSLLEGAIESISRR